MQFRVEAFINGVVWTQYESPVDIRHGALVTNLGNVEVEREDKCYLHHAFDFWPIYPDYRRLVGYWRVRVSIASYNPSRVADAVAKIKSGSGIPDVQVQGITIGLPATDTEARLEKLLTDITADGKLDHIVVTSGTLSGGMEGLVRGLALDMAPLKVNVVNPGAAETELRGEDGGGAQAYQEVLGADGTARESGTPGEVAEASVYLVRDSNITGAGVASSGGVVVQNFLMAKIS
ncbi:hypothetical protein DL767_009483 [Monosporascus sp. MG133]|nr:hypothetical protein DL767_009483 [Monosporascus sp. MG133]